MNETPITITGNLTADPELRFIPTGKPVATLRVASNSRRFDRSSSEWVDGETSYFDVEVWRSPAQNVAESLGRGHGVIVTGKLVTQTWQPEGADKPRSKFVVVADDIGPSLRYATAKPVKTTRTDSGPDSEEEPF